MVYTAILMQIFNRKSYKKRILHECSCFIKLINKLGKSDKMRGLQCMLLLFPNKFNKFNNTGA